MGLPLSELLAYMRVMCDDYDISLQIYSDKELIDNLRVGIIVMEASWKHGYSVVLNPGDNTADPPIDPYYEIVGDSDVPQWLQILYCLKTIIGMKAYQERYSYDNKVIKVTNADQGGSQKTLKDFYDEIIDEQKSGGVGGFAYTSWDDFFTRPNLVINEINKGFR